MQEQQQQQQQAQAQGAPVDPQGDAPPPPPRQRDDDTWGLGSATALESLRRRNFRGWRPLSSEERPASK